MHFVQRGDVFWADLNPVKGREQAGRRPVLVIASNMYLEQADTLAIIVPCTTVDRGWPNHILLAGVDGLEKPTYAMTEQPRTITRDRFSGFIGNVNRETMESVDEWLKNFIV